jgi:hypothetical protein
LRDAVAVLEAKATPQELQEYRRLVLSLAEKVADTHRESGHAEGSVSELERAAIDSITEALG